MYGFVTIWLAALMASTTCCGAPIGGIAIPLTIRAFGVGWNCGSLGDTPPEVFGCCDGVVEVCPNEAAGSNAQQARTSSASKSGLSARFGKFSFVRLPG
jgi:hypothetical protein